MRSRQNLLLATSLLFTAACTQEAGDPAAEESSAIHSVNTRDTTWTSVGQAQFYAPGWTGACTGTLVGPRTVLVAAHCVAPVAKGCPKSLLLGNVKFVLTVPGDLNGASITYDVDDIAVNRASYSFSLDPNDPAGGCYSITGGVGPTAANFNAGLQTSGDVALLRIKIDTSKTAPFRVTTPMQVVTSVDGGTATAPGALRTFIDTARRFGALHDNRGALPTVVGFGNGDTTAAWRRAGLAWFTYDANWDANDVMRIRRIGHQNPDGSWTFDGASTAPGDSGSPLLVTGGYGVGQVPELPAGQTFVLGVLSTGDQTAAGQTVPTTNQTISRYSTGFAAGNRFIIESALAGWNIADGDWPKQIIHIHFPI